MITINAVQLKSIMKNASQKNILTYVPLLNKYMKEFEINTRLRVVYFLATIAVESGELKYTKELADGSAYEFKKSLGNTTFGDGKKYKGRGLIQLTGKNNYIAYKKYCGFDVVAMPELLEKPLGATRSAGWFFDTHGCNELADLDDLEGVRKKVNGGLNGLKAFTTYVTRAKKAIKDNDGK